ncbi:sec-5 [Pristionchus pacificus]|nr:sec-5 [Pristionchus pacificus]
MSDERGGPPEITGLSPSEGVPGTLITIRGKNLGIDQNDVVMLQICGQDSLHTMKWISSSKILARVGNVSNRGEGDVRMMTRSGGRAGHIMKFRVFIKQVQPLEESAVWVDETKTVPGRETIRNVTLVTEEIDALGLRPTKKMDQGLLERQFGTATSGNLRMENFDPKFYLLENYFDATLDQLREGITNLEKAKVDQEKKSEEMHRAHLYSLINCVSTLATLHQQLEEHKGEMAVTKIIGDKVSQAREKAESVFKDVLARKDTADATRNALSVLTRFKFIFFLPKQIDENMAKAVDDKMLRLRDQLRRRLIDCPTSFEEQSKLIKYLKRSKKANTRSDLNVFWKLANSYNIQDEHYRQRQEDINQMLTLTINLSSWLLLNALVPKTLTQEVRAQYSEQFAQWPPIPTGETKTLMISECVSNIREELSSSGFSGDIDMFAGEQSRETLVDLAVSLVYSIKKSMDELLNLRKGADGQVTPKRLLISICNLEYILGHSLKRIAHRLREASFKYTDVVYESRSKVVAYRGHLVEVYLSLRHSAVMPIVTSATYAMVPEEDVSDWAKELLMSVVLAQSELAVNAPQLSSECIRALVGTSMQGVLTHLAQSPPRGETACAQCVIDLSAIEGALNPFLSLDTKTLLNAYRAEMVPVLDQEKLVRCISTMRSNMRVAMESLEAAGVEMSGENTDEMHVNRIGAIREFY